MLSRQGDKAGAVEKLRESKQVQAILDGTAAASCGAPAAAASNVAANAVAASSSAPATAPAEVHPDLSANEFEVGLFSAALSDVSGLDEGVSVYATFTWELPGASPLSVQTEAVPPQGSGKAQRMLDLRSVHKLHFDRSRQKEVQRFFERRRAILELYVVPKPKGGLAKFFVGDDDPPWLKARGEVKMAALLTKHEMVADVPMRVPTDQAFSETLGFLKIKIRIRHGLTLEDPTAKMPQRVASAPAAPPAAKAKAAAAAAPAAAAARALPEEDEMSFANRLVSYNVLEWELEKVANEPQLDELGMKKEALEIRREMLQFQVESGALSLDAYLQQLREAIPREKQRSKDLKAIPGGVRRALEAFKHAQIMQQELDEALAAPPEE